METRLRKGRARILGALLVLMLVLMLAPGAVYAETVTLTQDNIDNYLTSSSMWDYNKVLPAGDYKLGGDINFNDSISRQGFIGIEGDVTIDLNGHKLSCTNGGTVMSPRSVVVVALGGKLTLKDSSEGQTGTISGGFYGVKANGSLVMEGGNIKKLSDQSQSYAIYFDGEGLTLKGGTVEGIYFMGSDAFSKRVYTMYADGGTVSGEVLVGSDTFIKRSEGATGSTKFTGSFNLDGGTASLVRVLTQQDFTGDSAIYQDSYGHFFLPAGTYKLGDNITLDSYMRLEGVDVTLDLAGYTLKGDFSQGGFFLLNMDSALTLNDSSTAKTGKIEGGTMGINLSSTCEFTMNGGTIINEEIGISKGAGGKVTINGGKIEAPTAVRLSGFNYPLTIKDANITGNITGYGNLYADGGTITGNLSCKDADNSLNIYRSADATAYTTFNGTVGDNVWAESGYYIVIFADESADPAKVSYILTDDQTNITEPTEPVRSGYNFRGWYNGETAWDFANGVIKDAVDEKGCLTLTANWSKKSGGSGTPASYSVNTDKTENGNVTLSGSIAKKGATVTVTVTPDKGYTLEALTVTDADGKEISLKKNSDGTYSFTMPGGKVNVAATFMDDNTMLNFFVDVKATDYFYDAVLWAVENGITSGVDENHFGPYEGCTRAQLVTFLWRAAGQPEAANESGMTDVAMNSYYTDAVAWAFENGIVGGYGNGLFGSDDTITREQMAVILYRFAQHTGMDTTQGGMSVREYKDYDSISDYAVTAIQWAVNAGVMQGYDGNLMPGQPCTRAQIVTMLYRLLGE